MNNFTYYNPVRAYFGKYALYELGGAVAPFGKRVLLAYGGGSIKRSGLYDKIMDILKDAGKEVFELPGVMPNPRTEKVYEGIALCREKNVDFLLAVGGGSTIDCCKAISVGACTDQDFWKTFYERGEAAEKALPLGVVLTLPATGSEMDMSSVITNWKTSEKNSYDSPLTFPKFSILDPTLTYTLPKNQTVNGIVDTMSHVFELYLSPPDEDNLTDRLAEGVLHTIIPAARTVMKDPTNYDARANLMWCSSFTLCGMLNNGKNTDWASHCIEHPLSAVFDVPHGAGLAVIHPNYMKYICPWAVERFERFARRIWAVDPAGKTQEQVAMEGIERTQAFFRELGAPTTLTELGIKESDLAHLAQLTDLSCWSYQKLTREDVRAILEMSL